MPYVRRCRTGHAWYTIDYGRISVYLSCHKLVLRNEWMNQARFGTDVEPSLNV